MQGVGQYLSRPTLIFHLARAWRARARRHFSEAAEAYSVAVSLAPRRTNLRIQLGNMLKDSGRLADAEAVYLEAITRDPAYAEAHLQLGHARKLMGRREQALNGYRHALALDPHLKAARHELVAAGDLGELRAAHDRNSRDGGLETLVTISSRLEELQAQIGTMRRLLPDALASVAYPLETYSQLRQLFAPPAPAPAAPGVAEEVCRIGVVLNADAARDLGVFSRQVTALRDQTHLDYLIHVVGADPDRRAVVERAAAADKRICWIAADGRPMATQERAAAVAMAANWIVYLAPGATLDPHALAWIAAITRRTESAAIFFDEEIAKGSGRDAKLKPILRHSFDSDSLMEANVCGETLALAASALAEIGDITEGLSLSGARSALWLALSKGHKVAHAPLALVRRDAADVVSPQAAASEHAKAVRAHLGSSAAARIRFKADAADSLALLAQPARPDARISIVIPTKDNLLDLKQLIESFFALAQRPKDIEILVINNGAPDFRVELDAALKEFERLTVVDMPEPFNWSRLCNIGAAATSGSILVFANDDMQMLTNDWDYTVRALLERPDVGAVGARLLYPDDTIQHAGVLFGWRGGVIHDGLYEPKDKPGPAQRWRVTRSVSAVTGAFIATRRTTFDAVSGFDALHFAVSYGDIDFALKLRSRGLRVLWTPAISLYHFESKTRGLDYLHPAKAARDAEEWRIMTMRWPGMLDHDPSLNPAWVDAALPFRLLSLPSRDRVWAYIEASAVQNPWLIPPPRGL